MRFSSINAGWQFHADNLGEPRRIIEFGAGKHLAQNLYLSTFGHSQTVVDLNPMLDVELVNSALAGLVALGIQIDPTPIRDRSDLARYKIEYIAPCDMRRSHFEDASFDACVTTSTLEHIPPGDLMAILAELKRILKPGGLMSSHIDYSDHYEHTDRSITRLNFLRFSEQEWKRYNHSNHYQNRMRHGHFLQLFESAAFEVLKAEAIDAPSALPCDIRPELLFGDDNDLFLHGRILLQA